MRFWFGATTVLLAATFAGAGNEELEALARDVLKTGKEFTTTLGTIKDKQTAEAAKARLVSVFKRLQGLEQKRNGLSPAQQKILQEKHGKELAATISLEIVLKESARLKKLPGVLEVFRAPSCSGISSGCHAAPRYERTSLL